MDDVSTDPVLYMRRTFNAPRQRVFDAFVRPEVLSEWFGPHGMACFLCEVDARPGGRYRSGMRGDSGSDHVVGGEYREVVAPERLVMTWVWEQGENAGRETLVTLRFRDVPDGTELILMHEFPENPEASAAHGRGWTATFDGLEAYLASD